METYRTTARTRVARVPKRAVYDKAQVHAILDDEEDYALPIWAGVVPLRARADEPVPDERILSVAHAFKEAER
ncbi:MAG: hypothetical protein ACYDC6_09890 [Acidobacteriaceae bacterium]